VLSTPSQSTRSSAHTSSTSYVPSRASARAGQLLAVLALPRRRPVDGVLGGDRQAAARGPLAELGELVAGLLVIGGDARPDAAADWNKQTLARRVPK
jgi:hypothetical protein